MIKKSAHWVRRLLNWGFAHCWACSAGYSPPRVPVCCAAVQVPSTCQPMWKNWVGCCHMNKCPKQTIKISRLKGWSKTARIRKTPHTDRNYGNHGMTSIFLRPPPWRQAVPLAQISAYPPNKRVDLSAIHWCKKSFEILWAQGCWRFFSRKNDGKEFNLLSKGSSKPCLPSAEICLRIYKWSCHV